MSVSVDHRALVEENYSGSPDYFREEFREAITQHKVVEGMWPTEALLAGGGGTYKVKADERFWKKGSNPMEVMKAQSIKPDDSTIEITFQNSQQFGDGVPRKFSVRFEHGVAVEIKEK